MRNRLLTLISIGLLILPWSAFAQGPFVLPADWKFDTGSQNSEAPGFIGKIHQARKNSNLSATISRGNAQLGGTLIDPNTNQAYENLAVVVGDPIIGAGWTGTTPVEEGGSFSIAEVVNFFTDADGLVVDNGNFDSTTGHPEGFFPGLPGADSAVKDLFSNGQTFAIDVVAWLDLPEGDTVLGVHHDDSVEIAFHPNDARDIFRQRALGFDSNSGETDRTVTVSVAEAGLYSVRLLMAQWNGNGMLEFYSAPAADPGNISLVNDIGAALPVLAWGALTVEPRPYVTAVSPAPSASGVAPNTTITVEMANADTAMPTMRVNDAVVSYTKTTAGGVTTLSYKPAVPFGTGETVAVELDYGAATAAWSFNTLSGRKALLVTGGGQAAPGSGDGWISAQLATRFGFDVTVVSDAAVVLSDADGADLIYNSSTVNSGAVADVRFETLEIPLINAEGANTDDFNLIDAPYAGRNGNNPAGGITTIVIDDNTHPLTQGLALGDLGVFSANVQTHWGLVPVNGAQLASTPGNLDRGLLYVIEEGDTVLTDAGEFTHPARRVHFGMGNDGAGLFTAAGEDLFDRVIEWALAKPVPEQAPVITQVEYSTENGGEVTLSWLSIPERLYIIEVNEKLTGLWGDLDDGYQADDELSTFVDNEAGDFVERFYRIRLIPLAE